MNERKKMNWEGLVIYPQSHKHSAFELQRSESRFADFFLFSSVSLTISAFILLTRVWTNKVRKDILFLITALGLGGSGFTLCYTARSGRVGTIQSQLCKQLHFQSNLNEVSKLCLRTLSHLFHHYGRREKCSRKQFFCLGTPLRKRIQVAPVEEYGTWYDCGRHIFWKKWNNQMAAPSP